jgi:ubiquinone/menaquinone biosynthesis C-methylase UbiE
MKPNNIKQIFMKIFSKQLRRPYGLFAKRVGNKMNEINSLLYDFTIITMRIADNDNILEIGFGNGKFFDRFFSKSNNLTISGLDFSPAMIKEANYNNRKLIDSGKLVLKLGNSDKIPFADQSFNKIFCINVIYFWQNPEEHLKEIIRVLKPDGKFFVSVRTKESMIKLPFTKYGFKLYNQDEIRQLLEANHFKIVQIERSNEPDQEIDGQYYKVESLCIASIPSQ